MSSTTLIAGKFYDDKSYRINELFNAQEKFKPQIKSWTGALFWWNKSIVLYIKADYF